MKTLDEIREQDLLAPPESDDRLRERYSNLQAIADLHGERVTTHFEMNCNELEATGEYIAEKSAAKQKWFKARRAAAQASVDVAEANLARMMAKKMRHNRPDLFGPDDDEDDTSGPHPRGAGPSQGSPLGCEARSSTRFCADAG